MLQEQAHPVHVPLLGQWESCSQASPLSPCTIPSPQEAASEAMDELADDCDGERPGPLQYSQPVVAA